MQQHDPLRALAAPLAGAFATACILGGCTVAPSVQGTWAPSHANLGGMDLPVTAFDGATLKLTDSTYDFKGDVGTYTVSKASTPWQMDIHGTAGPNAGRTILAIYELKGDDLTICHQLDATGARPAAFASPKSTKLFLVNYTRVK